MNRQPPRIRPGLPALSYRAGTYSTFMKSMRERLSTLAPLAGLRTRDADDPAIALMDGWAIIADVLTFYQERIANEGYLRTATERRSISELAHLAGYEPRPGLAASVYLAYTLEKDAVTEIPSGSRSQTIPGAGELPQVFETANAIEARAIWNNLAPRLERPQILLPTPAAIYLKGTVLQLKQNDLLLVDFGSVQTTGRVLAIEADPPRDRTKVSLQLAKGRIQRSKLRRRLTRKRSWMRWSPSAGHSRLRTLTVRRARSNCGGTSRAATVPGRTCCPG